MCVREWLCVCVCVARPSISVWVMTSSVGSLSYSQPPPLSQMELIVWWPFLRKCFQVWGFFSLPLPSFFFFFHLYLSFFFPSFLNTVSWRNRNRPNDERIRLSTSEKDLVQGCFFPVKELTHRFHFVRHNTAIKDSALQPHWIIQSKEREREQKKRWESERKGKRSLFVLCVLILYEKRWITSI